MRSRIITAGLIAAGIAGLGAAASAQQASPYAPRGAVDGGVPGIATPSFAGSFALATSGPAAGIHYTSETSYYAGGGVTAKFGP